MNELATLLYGPDVAATLVPRIDALIQEYTLRIRRELEKHPPAPIDQKTALLITYGDQVTDNNETPLHTLAEFLDAHARGVVSGVHILPFYPFSSDDGFSVMDYYAVDPKLGTWADVARVGEHFNLMFDAVINHASAQGDWFSGFLRDDARLFYRRGRGPRPVAGDSPAGAATFDKCRDSVGHETRVDDIQRRPN